MQYDVFKLSGPPDDLPDAHGLPILVFLPTEEALANALLSAIVGEIKHIASRRILSVYPMTAQNNMLARAAVLNATGQNDSPEGQVLFEAWSWIEATRAHSNDLEAQVLGAEDPRSVNIWYGWPPHAALADEVQPDS